MGLPTHKRDPNPAECGFALVAKAGLGRAESG
jgi:hypothetical protein